MEVAPRPLIDTMLKHRWVATHSIAFEKRDHINLMELEMIRQEIRDRVVSGRGHCRVVNLCDSRVVVGAFGKGRSSSKQMDQKLRAILPWAIAGEISLFGCQLIVILQTIHPGEKRFHLHVRSKMTPCYLMSRLLEPKFIGHQACKNFWNRNANPNMANH